MCKRILLIDDEQLILDTMRDMLVMFGYDVETAPDSEEALLLYKEFLQQQKKIDLVILDLFIPEKMSAKEAIFKFKALDAEINLAISTGHNSHPLLENLEKYGLSGIIKKPYSIDKVENDVQRLLAES